jgi:hypothetical protein
MPASYACFFQAMFSHCGRRRTFSDDIWIHSNDPPSCRSSSVMRMATAMDPPWSRSTVGGVGRRGSARVPSSGLLVIKTGFFVTVTLPSIYVPRYVPNSWTRDSFSSSSSLQAVDAKSMPTSRRTAAPQLVWNGGRTIPSDK